MADGMASMIDLASRSGLFSPVRLAALASAAVRWGPTLAAPVAASALANPGGAAIIDDRGSITWRDLDTQSTRLAEGLHALSVGRGDRLGLMCRNHREFVELTVAAAKGGIEVVYLNTGFAAPQLNEVLARESITAVAIDAEFASMLDPAGIVRVIVVGDGGSARGTPITEVRARRLWRLPLRASLPINPVLLTSGTTGTPKGARRSGRIDPAAATSILQRVPYRSDDVVCIASPLFHAWGFAQLGIATALGCTTVVSASFSAPVRLEQIPKHAVSVLAVVPVLLQRLLDSPDFDEADLSTLRIVASSGSALPVPTVVDWLSRVGPNLYNLYGSTEVGQATLATPTDLCAHPDTAGRTLDGTEIGIFDDDGSLLPVGSVGRIFVGSGAQFDGYTGGGGKEVIEGLMSTGDVGHLDETGLLYVTGRADDMIVSGGENVFPQEVEDVLLADDRIADVAVVGVPDHDFGQRLAAFVVMAPGAKITKAEARALVADQLARHKVPRDVTFRAELPRTATGKIQRSKLSNPAL
ncbi:AMP-binding protein [Ilumatobacter sp.]|uniref:AMP-binding protein n=1 Tax=Ilumatobacter sp. TaxID=1967498 RepID=UPI003751BA9E